MLQDRRVWIVKKPKFPFDHMGLYIENIGVFEISSQNPSPQWTTWEEFNCLNDSTGEEKTGVNISVVLQRIQSMIDSREAYNAFFFNCEHAVSQALTGRRESSQLQGMGALVGLALVV